jgi:alpha-beta hydrolase superfamily lysophospholipase
MDKLATLLFVTAMVLGAFLVSELSNAERVSFQHKENVISAYHLAPDDKNNVKGVILFVHGDGAIPYDAHGYYEHIWNHILDSGYAVFSWDKPGVGNSGGNWLLQSMKDRQDEVRAAISFLKEKYNYTEGQIGLMGFSQAGWVVPAVANNNRDVSFVIGVGFSMNWMDQGWYMTKTRMLQKGASKLEIDNAYKEHLKELDFLKSNPDYTDYLERYTGDEELMSEDRFVFVKKNYLSDATEDYKGITQPMLILLGEEDLNVNVRNTELVLQEVFVNRRNIKIHMIPDATHSLLKHPEFNTQKPGLGVFLRLVWDGEKAYSTRFINYLKKWLDEYPQLSES